MSGPRPVNIDLGHPLVDISMQVSANRLNEAIRVILGALNTHETQVHNLLGRVGDIEQRQELMRRELNRIAPAAGASSAELLEQILELKRDLTGLNEKTGTATKALEDTLGGRITAAEEAVKNNQEQRTRDLISREKDFTQLTADMQKLATRLGGLVIPDVAPLESAQKSLTKRLDEAEKLLVFASSFAAVWDADSARLEAHQRAPTSEKVEYVHSLPPMKMLRNQVMQELRVQAVERLDMLTHELRDKVDLHKMNDSLADVEEKINERKVEDQRMDRRLVALEQGPLRISSIEDSLRRLQQSKADVQSLDLKADMAALHGLDHTIEGMQNDINDLYDRVPKGSHSGGGGAGGGASSHHAAGGGSPRSKFGVSSSHGDGGGGSSRPSHQSMVPTLPSAAGGQKAVGLDNAAVQALERRVADGELQIKRLDDLKANRSELLRLHEYLDSKLQNFSAQTSTAVAQANAAAKAASNTLTAATRNQQTGGGAGDYDVSSSGGGGGGDHNVGNSQNNNNNNSGAGGGGGGGGGDSSMQQQQQQPQSGGGTGVTSPRPPAGSNGAPNGPIITGRAPMGSRQPHPPGSGASTGMSGVGLARRISPPVRVSPGRGGGFNTSAFSQMQQQMQSQSRKNQGLGVAGSNPFLEDLAAGTSPTSGGGSPGSSPQRRSPHPSAQIGNSWHLSKGVAVRDSAGHFCGGASLVPRHEESPPNIHFDGDAITERRHSEQQNVQAIEQQQGQSQQEE